MRLNRHSTPLQFIALLVTLTPTAFYGQAAAASTDPAADQADAVYQSHDWPQAESAYSALAKRTPENPRFWYRLGVCARADKHFDVALEAFAKAKAVGAGKGLPAPVADYAIAATYAVKGDSTQAFVSLKASADGGFSQTASLDSDAEWTALRGDAQFVALAKQVKHNAAPCGDAEFKQFDFWIGDWDVTAAGGGVQQGTSHISSEMGGCVIWENWTSQGSPYFGKSYNTYNVNLKRWEQYWVDNGAGTMFFHGNLKDGVMDYWMDDVPQPNGGMLRRHLQFFNLSPNTVRQFSQGSIDGGKTWYVEYDFTYTRHVG